MSSKQAKAISPDFPYHSRYENVFGSQMHYVEEYGHGTPNELIFLFLHGNPTSGYLWRNVIPYVKDHGRAIVPDLIGMGKSSKPNIDYTFQDHSRYLEEFIAKKRLDNIILVLHDWGSGLGFHFAFRNQHKVKGIVFMEAITKPMSWKDINIIERWLFRRFRHERKGHRMIAKKNFFINVILFKMGTKRKLTQVEKDRYNAPYRTIESRKPIAIWPREIPFDGLPQRNHEVVSNYSKWLQDASIPKLLLYAKPGMIIKKNEVKRIKDTYKNLEAIYVGRGKHYIQEDRPHEIGRAIEKWAENQAFV